MAWIPFDNYLKKLLTQADAIDHDDANTSVKIALIANVAIDRANHDFWNDLQANEVSGGGYTANGNVLGSKTVTVANNVITFDSADPANWSQAANGFTTARFAIMIKDTANATTAPLMMYANLGGDKGNVDGDLTIQLDANGIATLAAS